MFNECFAAFLPLRERYPITVSYISYNNIKNSILSQLDTLIKILIKYVARVCILSKF